MISRRRIFIIFLICVCCFLFAEWFNVYSWQPIRIEPGDSWLVYDRPRLPSTHWLVYDRPRLYHQHTDIILGKSAFQYIMHICTTHLYYICTTYVSPAEHICRWLHATATAMFCALICMWRVLDTHASQYHLTCTERIKYGTIILFRSVDCLLPAETKFTTCY